jgi:hypothetical protein
METIEVFAVGTQVEVHGIEMVITTVNIVGNSPHKVQYKCEWADGKTVRDGWYDPWQCTEIPDHHRSWKIGLAACNGRSSVRL